MKRKVFKEEQIVRILREAEVGKVPQKDFCKKHGVSEQTFYRWKAKFGGMDVDEAKRLRHLESENARLKKMLAEKVLENDLLQVHATEHRDHRDRSIVITWIGAVIT